MRRLLVASTLLLALAACATATTYYVTVAGLGGTPEYETQFEKWAQELDRAFNTNSGDVQVQTLSGPAATREKLKQILGTAAATAKSDDAFALFLIGHGTFDGVAYKFNLPGPDVTAGELASMLDRIPARRQLVVNMTSCSGASLSALARKDRIVIAATKSGTETNATVFARYWVDAMKDPAADTDKNGIVSALEAFVYAQRKVTSYFETEKLLATEHAGLTDNGAATPVRDPKPENGHGLLASAFPLIRSGIDGGHSTVAPEKQKLVAKKEELEAKIDRLKYQKAAMQPDDYKQQLTGLLVALARTQAEIDQ